MEAHARDHDGWMHRLEDEYDFLMRRAEFRLAGGFREQARQDYLKAASLSPQSAPPHVGLGVVALHTHHLQEAQTAFETAFRLDAVSSRALCGLAIVRHRRGQSQAAMHMYRRCLELDGDNMAGLLGLFDLSAAHGRFDDVRRFLKQ